jgi:hypothetical protein
MTSEKTFVELRLSTGDEVVVDETLEAAEKRLSDAARSGQSRLAWFADPERGDRIGVNPEHVVSVRSVRAGGAPSA